MSLIKWLSRKEAIDINWFIEGQKELHVPAITVLSFQVFPLDRGKATRRKEKKAEDCTDSAIWAQTEITSDFNSWKMWWHLRNLICVIHNCKIGRNAASDRYSIFNMTVSFRSFQFFGATLCCTATSKINLYRLRDLEIWGPLSKCSLRYWSRILPLILCLWSPIPGFWSQIPPLWSLNPHISLRLCNYILNKVFRHWKSRV